MFTIYDYIKYYKDSSLTEVKWNMIDNLLCSIILYTSVKTFYNSMTFNKFCNEVINAKPTYFMEKEVIKILNELKDSKRYKPLIINNFINEVNDKVQFGAMSINVGNKKIISFKGSDGSIIGWLENFKIAYEYPTYTQKLAYEYLNKNINFLDDDVIVLGHSKGGNMAMSGCMQLNTYKFNKISKIINFDGPGFRKQEFESKDYKNMSKKLINIIPSSSYVGVILYNNNYESIKTSSFAINVHFPTFWNMYGQFFVKENLSKLSSGLHEKTTVEFDNLDQNELKKIIETTFDLLGNDKTKRIKLELKDIPNIYNNIKDVDPKTFNYLGTVISTMIKGSKK